MSGRPQYRPWEMGARCSECPLYFAGKTPVPPTGPLDADWVFVGEGPAKWEEIKGQTLCGPSGQKLNELLYHVGRRRESVFATNAIMCVKGTTNVRMGDGSLKPIAQIVNQRLSCDVECVDLETTQLTTGRVVDWFRNRRAGRPLIRVSSQSARRNSNGLVGATVTGDHSILTDRGWVRADQLSDRDLLATGQFEFADAGYEVLVGSMLGDGTIPLGRRYFKVAHVEDSLDYVRAKFNVFSSVGGHLFETPARGQIRRQFGFQLPSSAWFESVREAWYGPSSTRRVPRDLVLTPRALAVAYFDNGSLHQASSIATLGTDRLPQEEVEFVASVLRRDLGLDCKAGRAGPYFRVRFTIESTKRLSGLVRDFAPPSMRYKLVEADRLGEMSKSAFEPDVARTTFDVAIVERVEPKPIDADVYCIEVEKHHNFVTPGAVLKNCRAEVPGETGKRRYDMKSYMAWHRKQNVLRKREGLAQVLDPFTCCLPRLRRELEILESAAVARGTGPNGLVVTPLGNFAITSVAKAVGEERIGGGKKLGSILKMRGSVLEVTP